MNLHLGKILDSGPPPAIECLKEKTERTGNSVRLTVRLLDASGGIGSRMLVRVNERIIGHFTPDELRSIKRAVAWAYRDADRDSSHRPCQDELY